MRLKKLWLLLASSALLSSVWVLSERQDCDLDPVLDFISPDKQSHALVFVKRCEGPHISATGFHTRPAIMARTEVTILAIDETLPTWFEPAVFFAATDFTHDPEQSAAESFRKSVPLDVAWTGPKNLTLRFLAVAHVFKHDQSFPGGYSVSYESFPASEINPPKSNSVLKARPKAPRTFDLRSDPSPAIVEIFIAVQTLAALSVAGAAAMTMTRIARIRRKMGYVALLAFYTLLFGPSSCLNAHLVNLLYRAFFHSGQRVMGNLAEGAISTLALALGYCAGCLILTILWRRTGDGKSAPQL